MRADTARRASLRALAVALLLPAACSCPPLVESYASPEDTLLTWQARLCRDDAPGEYGCLSAGFQREMGGFPTYHAARTALLSAEPTTAWLFARADLLDQVTASSEDEALGRARLSLGEGDERVDVDFERETWLTLDWDDGRHESFNQDQPLSALLGSQLGRQWLTILKPALTPEQIARVRGLKLEGRWKIAALSGLGPGPAGAVP
jgi:hypothetical protein